MFFRLVVWGVVLVVCVCVGVGCVVLCRYMCVCVCDLLIFLPIAISIYIYVDIYACIYVCKPPTVHVLLQGKIREMASRTKRTTLAGDPYDAIAIWIVGSDLAEVRIR